MQVLLSVEENLYFGSDEVVVWWRELEVQIQVEFTWNLFGFEDKDDYVQGQVVTEDMAVLSTLVTNTIAMEIEEEDTKVANSAN